MSRNCPTCGQRWRVLTGAEARKIRLRLQFTLRQLAEQTGYDYTYLSKLETGQTPMTRGANKTYKDLALIAGSVGQRTVSIRGRRRARSRTKR